MKDLMKLLDNNGKLSIYTGRNIHGLYQYLEIIVPPTTLTTSYQLSHHFGPSSSNNIDKETLQAVISYLCVQQKNIYEWCERIVHKDDACIIV